MPLNAPVPKLAAVRGYGANVILCEPTQAAREETARQVVERTGGVFVHPYDHGMVMAGQGTLVLEFLEQVEGMRKMMTMTMSNRRDNGEMETEMMGEGDPLDAVVVPVGGGGMLSGCVVAAKSLYPNLRVFGAEPETMDDCARGFKSRERVREQRPLREEDDDVVVGARTIADGLMTTTGDLTWPVIRDWVDDVFTVTEKEIVDAMKVMYILGEASFRRRHSTHGFGFVNVNWNNVCPMKYME
jgi:threonine dehydratase/serine racemase